jgi:hypothetical protein
MDLLMDLYFELNVFVRRKDLKFVGRVTHSDQGEKKKNPK